MHLLSESRWRQTGLFLEKARKIGLIFYAHSGSDVHDRLQKLAHSCRKCGFLYRFDARQKKVQAFLDERPVAFLKRCSLTHGIPVEADSEWALLRY